MKKRSYTAGRMTAFLLCAVLIFTSFISFPMQSYGAVSSSDTEAVKSIAYNVMGAKEHYYSDDYFRGDSMAYDPSLAMLSMSVGTLSYKSGRATSDDQSRNLREFLLDNGFSDFEVNSDYMTEASAETSAVACAHKSITDNGKEYTLLAIIPRSGTFGAEFNRTLNISGNADDKGDSEGYDLCKEKAVSYVREYIKEHGIKGNLKVWTTGYSGGAGVCNLLSAEIINDPAAVLGNPEFSSSNLYSYCFSPLRIAAVGSDPKNSRYDCIHNVFDDADFLMYLIPSEDFDRYGTDFKFRDYADKDKALEMMKIDSESFYDLYVGGMDPDQFAAYKIDFDALINDRKLVLTEDRDSYLINENDPDHMATYLEGLEDSIAEVCAEAGGGDSRKGYYTEYQKPISDLVSFFFESGINSERIDIMMKAFTETDTSGPLMLSMYTGFMVNKSKNLSDRKLKDLIEQNFSRIAAMVEDGEGNLKRPYSGLRIYKNIKEKFFTLSGEDEETVYELSSSLGEKRRSMLVGSLKKLIGKLYARSIREALGDAGIPEETIEMLTDSEEKCEATAWFLTYLMFGNGMQSDSTKPLDPENEQFRQLATFIGNMSRYTSNHMYFFTFGWYRAADPYCADYATGTDAQMTGYRRVFISEPSGASVSGTVTDGNGQVVAAFRDGKMISRADEWIGITTADSGNWLRLPIDKGYRVEFSLSKNSRLDVSIDDYSVNEGVVVRSVTKDNKSNWTGIAAKSSDSFTIDMPPAEKTESGYDLKSAYYSLSIKKGNAAVPKPANVKVKVR